MILGRQLIAWRTSRELNQGQLSEKAGLTRAYVARLEAGRADPSLSVLQRLSAALEITVGKLLEEAPPHSPIGREELDHLARAVFHPGAEANRDIPHARALARAFQEKRAAMGLYRPRSKKSLKNTAQGNYALKRIRAVLGEESWKALLNRIDKHAPFQGNP